MKKNKKDNFTTDWYVGRDFEFRKVKHKFYAGTWFEENDYVPVNREFDNDTQYCIQLNITTKYLLDKYLFEDKVYKHYLTFEQYQHYTETDWEGLTDAINNEEKKSKPFVKAYENYYEKMNNQYDPQSLTKIYRSNASFEPTPTDIIDDGNITKSHGWIVY